MPRHRPLPDALAPLGFSVREALDRGVTPGRLRSGDLEATFHGVRTTTTRAATVPYPAEGRRLEAVRLAQAYAPRMPLTHAFSHRTAALLHGMRAPGTWPSSPIDVSVIGDGRPGRARGVAGHRLPVDTPMLHLSHGIRVTSPIATWVSLAAGCTVDELIELGDGLVRRHGPDATMDTLRTAVSGASGRTGAARLRAAITEVRPRTDSARETRLRLMLVREGLPEPEVNGRIENEYGAFVAFGDLVYRHERVLIEYDGGQHRTDERQFHRDIDRLDDLMELGYRVIRVNKSLMARPAALFAKVRAALTR